MRNMLRFGITLFLVFFIYTKSFASEKTIFINPLWDNLEIIDIGMMPKVEFEQKTGQKDSIAFKILFSNLNSRNESDSQVATFSTLGLIINKRWYLEDLFTGTYIGIGSNIQWMSREILRTSGELTSGSGVFLEPLLEIGYHWILPFSIKFGVDYLVGYAFGITTSGTGKNFEGIKPIISLKLGYSW